MSSLSIYLPISIWSASIAQQLWIMILETQGCMYPFEFVFLYHLGKCLVVQVLDHRVSPFLTFWWISILFSRVTASFAFPSILHEGSFVLHSLTINCYFLCYWINHSERCEVISHCNFDWHFPDDVWCVYSFLFKSNKHLALY